MMTLSQRHRALRFDRRHLTGPGPYIRITWLSLLAETLKTWAARRRQRRDLGRLSDHQLKDIGLTPLDAQMEMRKPFWEI